MKLKIILVIITIIEIILLIDLGNINNDKIKKLQNEVMELQQEINNLSSVIETKELIINALQSDFAQLLEENKQLKVQNETQKVDRSIDRTRYELTPEERKLVEQVVTAESRDEPYDGQILVCQCILNACENLNKRPADIIRIYKYAKSRPKPTDSVKRAVSAVFDRGEQVTNEKVIYFYAPALVESKFHEAKRFICEVAGHRFFAEK